MRTPNTFQIGSTTYTTREYCNARGITDNARILKIQWRINTYIRNHTIQQTIEELDRLTLHPTHSTCDNTESGIRPWLGTKQERIKAQQENKEATTAMKQSWIRRALERTKPEENTTTVDPRLQNLEKIRETSRPNAIENAITQYAEAIQTVNRRKKELAEAQNALNRWAEVTANLLNAETSSERTNRFNKVNNT
jgi:DNA anti-recombination protein RmuC